MLNAKSTQNPHQSVPPLVIWLLTRLANPAYRQELIGDIEEEYIQRKQANQETRDWLTKQFIFAIWDGQKAMLKTTGFVRTLSIICCLLVLPTIALFVGWLSNMREVSENLWQLLLSADIHRILLHSEYWHTAWNESGIRHLDIGMFIHIPSIIWALVFAFSAHRLINKTIPTAWLFAGFSLVFFLVPYLFGYALINSFDLYPRLIGPILAFMMLAPFFTLPVFVGLLFRRF